MARAFIAVEPPKELKRSIVSAIPRLAGVRMLGESIMHITLAFLGEVDEKRVADLKVELGKVRMYPFDITFRGTRLLGTREHAVLCANVGTGAVALASLHAAAREACTASNIRLDETRFIAHMTIGRIKDTKECGPDLEGFMRSSQSNEFGGFACESFFLESSMLTPSGPVYTKLLEVKLRGWQ